MKITRFGPFALTAALVFAACTDSSGPNSARIDVGRDSVELWVGDKVTLTANVTNSKGEIVPASVAWQSLTPVASVTQQGAIEGLKAGRGEIRITSGDLTNTLIVITLPLVTGHLYAPSPIDYANTLVQWKSGANVTGGAVLPSGGFTIRVPRFATQGELSIDSSEPRAFHPFLYPMSLDSVADLSIVLVPTQWT